ncbi:MAG: GNAT family N-acetyltransferase, partial [Rhizobiaceae bacterium]
GPDRTLTARITELEATSPPPRREHLPGSGKAALMRVSEMTPAFAAWLYERVGRTHHWFVRRNMPEAALRGLIDARTREFWVLYVGGSPGGFFELDLSGLPGTVDIALLGLMPEFQGRGLGRFLASEAMFAAFAHHPERVTIETNTLDHPRALPLYQKLGFSPTGSRTELVEPWT